MYLSTVFPRKNRFEATFTIYEKKFGDFRLETRSGGMLPIYPRKCHFGWDQIWHNEKSYRASRP